MIEPATGSEQTLQQILNELQHIRYRLGVLVFWFVALPIIVALVAWFVVSISNG